MGFPTSTTKHNHAYSSFAHETSLVHFVLFDRGSVVKSNSENRTHDHFVGGVSVRIKDLMGVHSGVTAEHNEVELQLSHSAGKLKVTAEWTGAIP